MRRDPAVILAVAVAVAVAVAAMRAAIRPRVVQQLDLPHEVLAILRVPAPVAVVVAVMARQVASLALQVVEAKVQRRAILPNRVKPRMKKPA